MSSWHQKTSALPLVLLIFLLSVPDFLSLLATLRNKPQKRPV